MLLGLEKMVILLSTNPADFEAGRSLKPLSRATFSRKKPAAPVLHDLATNPPSIAEITASLPFDNRARRYHRL